MVRFYQVFGRKTGTVTRLNAEYWISKLNLIPHPEGGYYRRTYQCAEKISDKELSVEFSDQRMLATSIYFLLTVDEVSNFHRLKSDEIWYFHAGAPLTVYVIHENGALEEMHLGLDLEKGQVPQVTVPKGTIFGSKLTALDEQTEDDYALVSCMVTPGFDYRDFELFSRSELLAMYPQHEDIIRELTRETSDVPFVTS